MRIQTGRDPFARQTIRKRKVHPTNNGCYVVMPSCKWCGTTERTIWQYYVEDDQPNRDHDIPGVFCGIDCLNSYHC